MEASGASPSNCAPAGVPVRGEEAEPAAPDTCAICTDVIDEAVRCLAFPCLHAFCIPCLKTWLARKNTCPLCNAAVRYLIVGVTDAGGFATIPVVSGPHTHVEAEEAIREGTAVDFIWAGRPEWAPTSVTLGGHTTPHRPPTPRPPPAAHPSSSSSSSPAPPAAAPERQGRKRAPSPEPRPPGGPGKCARKTRHAEPPPPGPPRAPTRYLPLGGASGAAVALAPYRDKTLTGDCLPVVDMQTGEIGAYVVMVSRSGALAEALAAACPEWARKTALPRGPVAGAAAPPETPEPPAPGRRSPPRDPSPGPGPKPPPPPVGPLSFDRGALVAARSFFELRSRHPWAAGAR
ncbi:ubiquitin E3 ligase ICP0 [Bovine alphaherpesvirus 2]|uniref:RING-type E3 ubiquitin transferase n=1 Tax=Bovine alphaherpesvirus 2 TaxID=10295 RepID=A0A7T1P4L3_9ALPH|nr:ubiquitin E3 ligase ICP0 [Bovine alphaherpesvirus 2]QPO25267.1 ubiquitin E3 ligase ICP0 [Bovine alphaherpesvirus 2]